VTKIIEQLIIHKISKLKGMRAHKHGVILMISTVSIPKCPSINILLASDILYDTP